jgi:TrmH family RNA methyltransferase
MFPVSKLGELPPRTRLRKIARILQALEVELCRGKRPAGDYLAGILAAAAEASGERALDQARALSRLSAQHSVTDAVLLRALNALRHEILRSLGAEPAEWDLLDPATGQLDRSTARPLPFSVYLEDIRSPFNVGAIFRTAEAFGARRILLSPRTPPPTHPRAHRSARGAEQAVSWDVCELAGIGGEKGIFALELGGIPLEEFAFPPQGLILVGSEELGLSPEALALADAACGRVSIPLAGAKRSLNVAVAFGIIMQAWYAAAAPPEGSHHQ